MNKLSKLTNLIVASTFFPYIFLTAILLIAYYKLFFLGKIPFPGDLLVASYSPWLDYYKLPVQNPLISDVFSQFFLWKYLSIESWKSFQWPLWNPYSFSGTPLLATYHSAVLYPLNFLLFLPKYFGWGIYILSQTAISLIAMYLLLYYWTKSTLSATFGSVILAFGGLMTTWLELGTAGHAMAWLPMTFLAIELYIQKLKIRYLILLTASLSFLILAGHAQITTFSFVLIFLFSLFRVDKKNLKSFVISFIPLLLALIVSILICLVQLLPSYELLQNSIRLTESYTNSNNFGLLPFIDILKFFIADFFGNPVTRNYWDNLNYSESSGFLGTLSLPLLIYSFLYLKRNKLVIFFLTVFSLSIILTFNNPISYTIYQLKIPLLTSSYASRMLFVTLFSAAALCTFSLNQVLRTGRGKYLSKVVIWSWASLIGVLLGTFLSHFLVWDTINLESNEKYLEIFLKDPDFSLTNFLISEKHLLLPLFLISSYFIATIFIQKIKIFPVKFLALILCLTLLVINSADLLRYFLKFNPFVSQTLIFPTVPALDYLQKQPGLFRVGREHAETFTPNTWIAYHLQSYEGYDPIYLNDYGKFMHFLNGGDLRKGNSSRYAELSTKYNSPFLNAGNSKYFIAILRDKEGRIPGDLLHYRVKDSGYKLVFKDKSAAILENTNALGRVYFASSAAILSQSSITDVIMDDPNFDPTKQVLLSKDINISTVTGKGQIVIDRYFPNLIKMRSETLSDEVLVLADQFEEGWHAKIDNKETAISPANFIFRAIKVPAGKHEITFWYWPRSFDIGLKISSLTLLVFVGLILISIKRRIF